MSYPPPEGGIPPSGPPLETHRGVMILVFGILSFFCCPIVFGLLAWFWGSADLAKMDQGRMNPEGRGLTNAGRIMGVVGMVLWALFSVVRLALVLAQR